MLSAVDHVTESCGTVMSRHTSAADASLVVYDMMLAWCGVEKSTVGMGQALGPHVGAWHEGHWVAEKNLEDL
jgi:hypothetical protein